MALIWRKQGGIEVLVPDGEAGIVFTSRNGGVSAGAYRWMNLGPFTGDSAEAVSRNRRIITDALSIPPQWRWVRQVHGATAAEPAGKQVPDADALVTTGSSVLAVFTADCMPIAIKGQSGVAAIHAGWRGLTSGVIESGLSALRRHDQSDLRAWIGPSIGPCHYEVGPEVAAAVRTRYPAAPGLAPGRPGRFTLDLRSAARWVLEQGGVKTDASAPPCTYCDERFFSHRRENPTGRQAVLVWRPHPSKENAR
ncbi:MAG: peptidoglycan editing factor PgeF [Actinomycetota bacterium]